MSQVRECETPEDRMVEILSRLPPKSLMRFKCIRKSWCTLINSPCFVAKHLSDSVDNKLSSSTCILLNCSQAHVCSEESWKQGVLWSVINLSIDGDELHYDIEDLTNAPFLKDDHHEVEIHGYCDGIVCVTVDENFFLCNPATGEFRQLPDSCLLLPLPGVKEKFGLETTLKGLGFGYDCKAKEYKVVRIIENYDCEYSDGEETYIEHTALPHTAEVYTTTANSWKEIKINISSKILSLYSYPYSCSVYLKGFCYWLSSDDEEYICSFNLGDEIFDRIELPSRRESGFKLDGIFLYNESITYYCTSYEERSRLFEIWVMDNYDGVKSSWTKHLTAGPFKGIEFPLTLRKHDELLMIASDGRATSYNSSTRNLKYLHIPVIIYRNRVIDYAKSIVPVKRVEGKAPFSPI
ncbi:F-box/kelch-repeat protein At3g06240-like isoform X2 [Malus sylvestris]|uniref:F-box/kelch-repeat protein At3g06240-like isoform X2 n=1 Tax=Malus sylvestris TaxID=3752 RepID=UPI0021AB9E8D|nr:F-box/kelch-repeat protein At3g06240-like isoform X2 [Malus sylvestris]